MLRRFMNASIKEISIRIGLQLKISYGIAVTFFDKTWNFV